MECWEKPYLLKKEITKPLGLEPVPPRRPPIPAPQIDYLETTMCLHRPNKAEVPRNMVTFMTDQSMSRPEIRQYLTKLYGLDVDTIATLNRRPKFKIDMSKGKYKKVMEPGKKVAYVYLKTAVDPFFQKVE